MSTIIMNKCWPLKMTSTQKAVLISLADNANDEGVCWPSIAKISERTCLSERAIQTAIKCMAKMGLIIINSRIGRSTVFQITVENYTPAPDAPRRKYTPAGNAPSIEPSSLFVNDENIVRPEDEFVEENIPIPVQPIKTKKQSIPYQKIINLYEEILPELPQVNMLTESRKSHIRARWNDHIAHQSLEFWKDYFLLVKNTPFLLGKVPAKNGGKAFRANIDWLINPANFVKVTEGYYE